MQRGEIRLKNETVADFPRYPISRGVPLPPGWAREPDDVRLCDENGDEVPSRGTVLQRRPDGSIEWMLVDVITDLAPEQKRSLFIHRELNQRAAVDHPVRVTDEADAVTIDNGLSRLVIPRPGARSGAGSLIRQWVMHGSPVIDEGEGDVVDLEVTDMDDKRFRASVSADRTVTIEHQTDLRVTLRIDGKHAARDGSTFFDYTLRLTLYADRPDLRIAHTFVCREKVNGVVRVKSMRLVMPTRMDPTSTKLMRQSHHGHTGFPRGVEVAENVELIASSVNDVNDFASQYKPHKMGTLYLRNYSSMREDESVYPFHMPPRGGSAFRADYMTGGSRQVFPWLGWREPGEKGDKGRTLVLALRHWRQLHPTSVAIDDHTLSVAFWPAWSIPMEVVKGVSKTHDIRLAGADRPLDVDACEQLALQWEVQQLDPICIEFDPAWPVYCEAMDCHHMLRYQPEKHPALENRLRATPGEPNRFTYPRNNPTGMFDFGDAGGEGGFTNNEDDVRVFVPLRDYLRTGRMEHFDYGQENALHYMEVDFCLWSDDPRQHGGFIPHTVRHFVGNVYPSHQWAEGVLAYHYITGDPRARNAVIMCGDNQIHWIHHVLEAVVCDGREAGMPLVNLAAAYRLTRDQKYLDAAWIIIENFQKKWYDRWGDLKYPYPQGGFLKWITGYGDWSSYYGLYRLYEVSGDERVKELLLNLLKPMLDPNRFSVDDSRGMDFMAVWSYIHLTGDRSVLETLRDPIENFIEKGGHPMRRLEMLHVLDEEGWLTK